MRVGCLVSRIRAEEKLIFAALESRGVEFDVIDIRHETFEIADRERWRRYDVVLDRCVSQSAALAAMQILTAWGVRCVNSPQVIQTCSSKLETSAVLNQHQIPIPRTSIAFTPESALNAMEEFGFPVVLKPVVGSWGRLLAKVNDRDAAEAILEHKSTLGSYQHSVFYIQEYIQKPERDLRTFVMGDQVVAGIYRYAPHWITNTARQGRVEVMTPDESLCELSLRAARAVGGGMVAVDFLETPDRGLLVNEINHCMEFRNSLAEVDIPNLLVDYLFGVVERGASSDSNTQPAMVSGGAV